MSKQAAIADLDLARLVKQVREAHRGLVDADRQIFTAQQAAAVRRLELGRLLMQARTRWPSRGPNAKGWGEFLRDADVNEDVALVAMKYAGYVEKVSHGSQGKLAAGKLPTLADAGLDNTPRKSADDGVDRDAYCTPLHVARALPKQLGLDPCSNPRSVVVARVKYSLETGQNGLEEPWFELFYANIPFSDPLPWAQKHERERERGEIAGGAFMVNTDHSTEWWELMTVRLTLRLDFDERLEFIPPPGVEPSKNARPQTMLMDEPFWAACDQVALLELGTLWTKKGN